RAAAAASAAARSAVPPPGPVGHARLPPTVSPRARRFGRAGHSAAGPLRRVRGDGRARPRGRRAGPALGRDEYAYFLYRGRPARGRGTGHGLPDRIRLDLPEQDGGRGALMGGARPSFIYRLSIGLAQRALPFAARFDKKLARGLDARRGVRERLSAWARAHRDPKRPLLWVHAPSVGEGLQAKPVLEAVRAEAPHWQLAYTFFSPSAERLARTLPVDVADYLPLDRPADVTAVLEAFQPAALVFSKLDVWPELTLAAARRGVKLGLISATVAPHSSRLRWPARGWAEPAYRAPARVGLPRPVRLSQVEHTSSAPVIVVDRVGILADLYALADVAFVGGGYHRAGLHSVLEPAVFGVPVAVGPHWHMSRDATLLIERGGAVAL